MTDEEIVDRVKLLTELIEKMNKPLSQEVEERLNNILDRFEELSSD